MTKKELYSAIITFDKDQVLIVRFKDGVDVDKKELIKLIDISLEIVKGNSFHLLIDARDIHSSIDHNSRDYFSKHKEYNRLNIAQAIVVNNTPVRLLAKFYFQFYKHQNPVKVFSDIDEAKKWLLKQG